jgi:hypothetical protein
MDEEVRVGRRPVGGQWRSSPLSAIRRQWSRPLLRVAGVSPSEARVAAAGGRAGMVVWPLCV